MMLGLIVQLAKTAVLFEMPRVVMIGLKLRESTWPRNGKDDVKRSMTTVKSNQLNKNLAISLVL
jgi:hypothetical protein